MQLTRTALNCLHNHPLWIRPLATRGIAHFTRTEILPHSTRTGIPHSTRISLIRRSLSPDGRGGRFNCPGQTCPDPSVTPIRRTRLTCPRSPHLAPGVWTTKPPCFPCFPPRLSWVQGLPMKPISPGLNQVAKGLTQVHKQLSCCPNSSENKREHWDRCGIKALR